MCCFVPAGAVKGAVLRTIQETALRSAFREITSAPAITISATVTMGPVAMQLDSEGLSFSASGGAAVAATVDFTVGTSAGELGTTSLGGLTNTPVPGVVAGGAVHFDADGRPSGGTLSGGFGIVWSGAKVTGSQGAAKMAFELADKTNVGMTPKSKQH